MVLASPFVSGFDPKYTTSLLDKILADKIFRRTKFSAASQTFGSFGRRNCVR